MSAGAAQGVASALIPGFSAATGTHVRASFAPVGALKERLAAGEACDVLISTASMLEDLARDGRVVAGTIRLLGGVHTGIAVRSGEPAPAIGDTGTLRSSLAAANEIYLPDPERATAGAHCVSVLRALGLHEALAARLRPYPNGASAMAALATTHGSGLIGCTQITEINATPGVALVGALPAPFDLVTTYAVAACAGARARSRAQQWIETLDGPDARRLLREAGFEP
jgi:molybdate transport system substrate-binding protein